uniref:Uncharacterized protein n=1 Tax=Davidia involucrata TaxID=16924 RepID=A0A5B7BXE3_DAVIN
MREMEECGPTYWSYTADNRFEPVKVAVNPQISNPVYRIPNPPRASRLSTSTMSSSSSSPWYTISSWQVGDPELKRRKRVASYKAYAVEGKVKASLRSSFRWIKNKYSALVYRC